MAPLMRLKIIFISGIYNPIFFRSLFIRKKVVLRVYSGLFFVIYKVAGAEAFAVPCAKEGRPGMSRK
jgi:hypothetical protein